MRISDWSSDVCSSDLLAVKSSDGTANGNLLTVSTVLRGNGSVEQGWTALIATHANLLSSTKAEQTTAQSRSDQAVAAREAVSGVDQTGRASGREEVCQYG